MTATSGRSAAPNPSGITKARLEAFSDGVLAIVITLLAFAVATVLFHGCQKKPTQQEVVEKYRDPVEKLRLEIASYADLLETDQRRAAAPLDPKPVFNFGNYGWTELL